MTARFEIKNQLGLHARAATQLVQLANRFRCEIRIRKGAVEVNGKSIMGVLQLAAARGQMIDLLADGEDSRQALQAIGELIDQRFGEFE